MHALAVASSQRFARKFTSNDIWAPAALKRRIHSVATSLHCGESASVIPLVWKRRAEEKVLSGISSREIVLIEEWRLS